MKSISAEVRRRVSLRAQDRCEYCGLHQAGQEATFHVDHIVPVSAKGRTELENLALACVSCSLRKAAKQMAIDPESRKEVRLFNPRQDSWGEHFRWAGCEVVGLTSIGRATVAALSMNRPLVLAIRAEELLRGRLGNP